jgi:hypothetical protein
MLVAKNSAARMAVARVSTAAHTKGAALGALQEHCHDKHDDDHEMNDDQDRLHGMRLWSNCRDALYRQAAATARVGAAIVVSRRSAELREMGRFLSILHCSRPSRAPPAASGGFGLDHPAIRNAAMASLRTNA